MMPPFMARSDHPSGETHLPGFNPGPSFLVEAPSPAGPTTIVDDAPAALTAEATQVEAIAPNFDSGPVLAPAPGLTTAPPTEVSGAPKMDGPHAPPRGLVKAPLLPGALIPSARTGFRVRERSRSIAVESPARVAPASPAQPDRLARWSRAVLVGALLLALLAALFMIFGNDLVGLLFSPTALDA
jgi:hypothetical protein